MVTNKAFHYVIIKDKMMCHIPIEVRATMFRNGALWLFLSLERRTE